MPARSRPRKKRCRGCRRVFTVYAAKGTKRDKAFCSVLCYQAWEQRNAVKRKFLGMSERKRLMAFGVYHNDQLKQLAMILNRSGAPQTEKEALLGDQLREIREARREIIALYRSLTPSEKKVVRKILWKAPALARPKGPFFCKSCGSNVVSSPRDECQRCRDKKYHVEVPKDNDTPEIIESSDYRRHKDEDAV